MSTADRDPPPLLLAQPEQRGVLIPIVFHFVLAGFLFAYGSAAIELRRTVDFRRARSSHL